MKFNQTRFELLLITMLLFTLKLTGVINWSWWIIFFPIWFSVALLIIVAFVGAIIESLNEKK